VKFSDVNFESKPHVVNASINSIKGSGKIEIRQDSLTGKLLGVIQISQKTNTSDFAILSSKLKKVKGSKDIYLKFQFEKQGMAEIDWISFSK